LKTAEFYIAIYDIYLGVSSTVSQWLSVIIALLVTLQNSNCGRVIASSD